MGQSGSVSEHEGLHPPFLHQYLGGTNFNIFWNLMNLPTEAGGEEPLFLLWLWGCADGSRASQL
jgi:hypothetical protein